MARRSFKDLWQYLLRFQERHRVRRDRYRQQASCNQTTLAELDEEVECLDALLHHRGFHIGQCVEQEVCYAFNDLEVGVVNIAIRCRADKHHIYRALIDLTDGL